MGKLKLLLVAAGVMIITAAVIMCIGFTYGFNTSGGKVLQNTPEIYAFSCHEDFGDKTMCGGSGTRKYKAVVRDGNIYVFYTFIGTTGDSGRTEKYIQTIDDAGIKKLKSSGWNYRIGYCKDVTRTAEKHETLTTGMNDRKSRNPDGSYKWEEQFNELIELR